MIAYLNHLSFDTKVFLGILAALGLLWVASHFPITATGCFYPQAAPTPAGGVVTLNWQGADGDAYIAELGEAGYFAGGTASDCGPRYVGTKSR